MFLDKRGAASADEEWEREGEEVETEGMKDIKPSESEEEEKEEEKEVGADAAEDDVPGTESPDGVAAPESPMPAIALQAFPILIRCAEARDDIQAALDYQQSYELALQENNEKRAQEVVRQIEEGAKKGSLLGKEGLEVGGVTVEVLRRLSVLLKGEVDDDILRVELPGMRPESVASVLTVSGKGGVRLEERTA